MRIAKFMVLPVVALLAILAAACGSSGTKSSSATTSSTTTPGTTTKAVPPTFVGKVSGNDAYIGMVAGTSGTVAAYVCDGAGNKIGDFFQGSIPAGASNATLKTPDSSDTLTVNAGQSQLQNLIATGGTVTGTWNEAGGASHGFSAQAAHPPGALWGEDETVNGTPRHAKWVVLNDGSVRGSLDLDVAKQTSTLGQSTGPDASKPLADFREAKPPALPADQTSNAAVMEFPKQTTEKSDLLVKADTSTASKTFFYITRVSPPKPGA